MIEIRILADGMGPPKVSYPADRPYAALAILEDARRILLQHLATVESQQGPQVVAASALPPFRPSRN